MNNSLLSFQDVLEKAVKEMYEKELFLAYSKLEEEFDKKWEQEKQKIRNDIKKEANALTLEMLQKVNINGISIEFKL